MSDLVSVAAIKDLLTECPICTEHFDDTKRIPRRMPCCVQSICQPCLETYSGGAATLSCPMCRRQHNLPGGVQSLPKETLILKTLDYLKIQKGLRLPCTDCPDRKTAVAQCDNCGTFLCSLCISAHKRNTVSKTHTINTFDEMKGRPVQSFRRLHQCSQHQQPLQFYCYTCDNVVCVSCTVVDHKEGKGHNVVSVNEAHQGKAKSTNDIIGKIEEKTKRLSKTKSALKKKIKNIKLSIRVASDDINNIFDNLVDVLNQRRTTLLSDVEGKSAENLKLTEEALDSTRLLLTKVKSSSEYMRQMRSKADKVEDLQVMGSSEASLNSMLKESPQEIPFDRTGVTFVQANVKHLQDTINVAGLVRSVTFTPTERPNGVPDTAVYNAITLEPAEFPTGTLIFNNSLGLIVAFVVVFYLMEMDQSLCDQEITCPTLEWDSSTAYNYSDVSGCVITNTTSAVPSPDTGCRIRNRNLCLASRPLMVKNCQGQRCMYRVKFQICVKELIQDNKVIQQIALTPTPVDAGCYQLTGLSVLVTACSNHKHQLCLSVAYNRTFLSDRPLIQNRVGEFYDLQLCFLMDGDNEKILVIDPGDNTVYTTVTDVAFDRPMWVMMSACKSASSDVRGELISGHNITGTFANYNHETSFHYPQQ